MLEALNDRLKGQISLEFLIVYSFVLIIFILLFTIVTTQRAAILSQQQYSTLQIQAQNIASYIDQAVVAGSGYSTAIPLAEGLGVSTYNISISTTGVIIASAKIGSQQIYAYAFSNAKNFVINGTLRQSGSGISVYQVQTQKGSMGITNSKGIIYIDEPPPSITSLAQGGTLIQNNNLQAAYFAGVLRQPLETTNAPIFNTPTTEFTAAAWLYPTNSSGYLGYLSKGTCSGSAGSYLLELFPGTTNGMLYPAIYLDNAGVWHGTSNYNLIPVDKWSFVATTFNSGTLTFYVYNWTGNSISTTAAGIGSIQNSLCFESIGIQGGCYPGDGEGCNKFDGDIANLQIYNTSLSASSIKQLYNKGITAQPINSSNVIGWWPLNGNANDYSGYGNDGTPTGVQYQSVIQLSSSLSSGSYANNGILVGFVGSRGYMGANSPAGTAYTNSNGIATTFLVSNTFGSANVVSDIFNGNLSTEGNLVGWWPLDTGYGSNAFDLSGNGNNGIFNNPSWDPLNQGSFTVAKFPGNPSGVISSNTGTGYITINNSQSLLNNVRNNSFTATAWIYFTGATSGGGLAHPQGIFGDMKTMTCCSCGAGGFQFDGFGNYCGNVVLFVNTSILPFPNGLSSFPKNTWEMVTAEYNGSTGIANVYLNNTVFATNALPKNLGLNPLLSSTLMYYIGGDAFQGGGQDSFNGSISDVQYYSSALNKNQINSLYLEGMGSTPLSNAGLLSWWPLAGNVNDYSFNNNTGTIHSNVSFVSTKYSSTASGTIPNPNVAYMNGYNSYISTGTNGLPLGNSARSIFAWIDWNGTTTRSTVYGYGNYGGGTGEGAALEIVPSGNVGYLYFESDILNGGDAAQFVPLDQWAFVGYTYAAAANGITIYINGNPYAVPIGGQLNTVLPATDKANIGKDSGGISYYFNGLIADVQVYNSVLTQQQILQLYGQGLPIQNRINVSIG
jgi:hypothetical protein